METNTFPNNNADDNSSTPHRILVEFISDNKNNKQWLNYAVQYLFSVPEPSRPVFIDPEDYVSEAKTFILKHVTLVGDTLTSPVFLLTNKNRSISMSRQFLKHYVFLLIKWRISHEIRSQKKIIHLLSIEEIEEINSKSDNHKNIFPIKTGNDLMVPFSDPFDNDLVYLTKEFIESCINALEEKDPFYKLIFEDRLDGITNKDIAAKYNISVHEVENYIKKIIRFLRNNL